MRQEVGAACLLPEGKNHPEGDCRRQQGARQPGPRVHQQEIERHQGEPARGMGAREAGGARQCIRPVLEQVQIRLSAAKADDVARAVHVGRELEDADDADAERDSDDEIGRFPTQRLQSPGLVAADEYDQRGEADHPDQG